MKSYSNNSLFLGGIYLFGCIIYWIWAEGEVQPWAIQEPEPEDAIDREDPRKNARNTQVTGFSNPALDVRE